MNWCTDGHKNWQTDGYMHSKIIHAVWKNYFIAANTPQKMTKISRNPDQKKENSSQNV